MSIIIKQNIKLKNTIYTEWTEEWNWEDFKYLTKINNPRSLILKYHKLKKNEISTGTIIK